jgi:polysaccharide biosynthesis/export protein
MIHRLLAVLACCALLSAVDIDSLPSLAPPGPPAQSTAGGTPSNVPQAMLDGKSQTPDPRQPTASTQQPDQQQPTVPPQPPVIDLQRWTERDILPPRLGGDLTTRSVPATRPLSANYRLRAGDAVRVVAWGGSAVNERVPVSPSGDLAVPGFGMVPVAGLTQAEAQARVLELVRSQFRQGGAVVAVEQPAAQAVTVVGEVVSPGYLTLPPGGTVLEALSAAGGVLPRGSLRAIRIASDGAQSEIDLYRIVVDGDAAVLAPLPPGALIFVPLAGPQVQVFGAVRRPSGIELKPGQDLAEALRLAGGLSADADPAAIRLLREDESGQQLRQLAATGLAGLAANDGDRILAVARRDLAGARGSVSVQGAVRSPGLYPLRPGLTLEQVVALAGGLLPDAAPRSVIVRRLLATPRIIDQAGIPIAIHHDILVAPPGSSLLQALDEVHVDTLAAPDALRVGVSISGAVATPGDFPFSPTLSLRDLVLLAGGVLPTAQIDAVDLVRSNLDELGQRTAQRLSIDLRPILREDLPGPQLQPGDAVVVRSTADARVRITLEGEFRNTGTFTVPAGTTIGQIISMAGGLLPEAFPRGARYFRMQEAEVAHAFLDDLIRRTEASLNVTKRSAMDAPDDESKDEVARSVAKQESALIQLRQATATGRVAGIDFVRILANDATADQVLQDGDRLSMPPRPGTVRILGEIMMPGSLVLADELSVKDVVRRSGGYTRQADQEAVFVVRADGSVVASAQGDTLAWDHERRRWARTTLASLKLEEGDAVIIPADVRYKDTNRRVVRDWSQIMFQIAATVGTIAIVAK